MAMNAAARHGKHGADPKASGSKVAIRRWLLLQNLPELIPELKVRDTDLVIRRGALQIGMAALLNARPTPIRFGRIPSQPEYTKFLSCPDEPAGKPPVTPL
jgi:hypothetical protein